MRDMVREAGWPVFLVLSFGAASLVFAVRHALDGTRDELRWMLALAATALVCATFGTVLGVQTAIKYIREIDESLRLTVFLVGLREALQNVVLALGIGAIDCMLMLAGLWRSSRRATP